MTTQRVNWFEIFGNLVQLYPKMSATIAFATMAAAARMIPMPRFATEPAAEAAPQLIAQAVSLPKRAVAKKIKHATRKAPKRKAISRRRAA